ncbi:hypothetical protein BC629DRAFT_1738152 [Irpex lacteus]|nr:hypothetical protein BC629DRAFT_1738152 [Irpex lacteus]
MATTGIAERADIHKSCKAIEGVVNLLNDYCDAAAAIAAIQKKLAKAVREASSIRSTNEIAVNALNACATVVEALVDVDSKFVKLADKECDSLSADVKKWFKVLAKEERTHDAKLSAANDKIRQAGQTYEKKVKKNPINAAEEHARYMNVLGTVGPEVSQEKYQHAMSVFQQHTTLILGMAVSVCRIVDAEWLRASEEVRKAAQTIGRVGEWRALCEGGWTGPIPRDLPDLDIQQQRQAADQSSNTGATAYGTKLSRPEDPLMAAQAGTPAPEYASRATTPSAYSPQQPPTYFSPKDASNERGQQDLGDSRANNVPSVNSIASLGSFPTPPSHFPIPPVPSSNPEIPVAEDAREQRQMVARPVLSGSPGPSTPEPPTAKLRSDSSNTNFLDFNSPQNSPSTGNQVNVANSQQYTPTVPDNVTKAQSDSGPSSSQTEQISSSSSASSSATSSAIRSSQIYKRGDYMDNAEFRARKATKGEGIPEESIRAASPNAATVDRRDISRSSSNVSVMREKFARATGPASPPPKDVPRLPLSVSNLATRYEFAADSQDQRREPKTPVEDRRMSADVRIVQGRESPVTQRDVMASPQSPSSYVTASSGPTDDEIARRRQRIRELEDLELREQEHELRSKEREIESRSRELEKDRQRLLMARTYRSDSPAQARQNLRNSTMNFVESPSSPLPTSRQPFPTSASANQARAQMAPAPSLAQRFPSSQSSSSQPSSPAGYQPSSQADHPDSCGCESCSVTKYNARPNIHPMASSNSLRPYESPISPSNAPTKTEKPRGWIRRLSMPSVMGNPFSPDTKKGISSANYMSGGGGGSPYRNSLAMPDEDGRLRALAADSKNRSTTNLIGRR